MDFGYLKVATASFDVKISNVNANVDSTIALMKEASQQGVDVCVFPELSVTGYTCGDLFLNRKLWDNSVLGLERIAKASIGMDTLFVVGAPVRHKEKLYNCAVFVMDGRIRAMVPKTYVPNYNEFYEKRWFSSGKKIVSDTEMGVPFGTNVLVALGDEIKIGVDICEDLWVLNPPSNRHCLNGANMIVNLSASNEIVAKRSYRQDLVRVQSAKGKCVYVYASAGEGESTTDVVFSGHCMIAENGTMKAENYRSIGLMTALVDMQKLASDRVRFNSENEEEEEEYTIVALKKTSRDLLPEYVDAYPFIPGDQTKRLNRCKEIMELQALGLYERLKKTGMKKAVIGISGGLDSTLALLVTVEAFDKLGLSRENIIAITMPGFGTSVHTKTNSDILMEKCHVTAKTISIVDACRQHMKDIGHAEDVYDVTYENIQARERTKILMDVANQEGGLVIGTGDLSEMALGWCTYNGDHMSMYGVNCSIPKTLVRYLVAGYATMHPDLAEVLTSICETVISPELLPLGAGGKISQSTEATIGKYDIHDFMLYNFIRNHYSKEKILALAKIAFPNVDAEEIEKQGNTFFRRFFSQQFKRSCTPDGPKVGSVSLSPRGDWRMPSDADVSDWL